MGDYGWTKAWNPNSRGRSSNHNTVKFSQLDGWCFKQNSAMTIAYPPWRKLSNHPVSPSRTITTWTFWCPTDSGLTPLVGGCWQTSINPGNFYRKNIWKLDVQVVLGGFSQSETTMWGHFCLGLAGPKEPWSSGGRYFWCSARLA